MEIYNLISRVIVKMHVNIDPGVYNVAKTIYAKICTTLSNLFKCPPYEDQLLIIVDQLLILVLGKLF